MNEPHSQAVPTQQHLIASVLLAEIAGYSDRPIFEQIDLTSRRRQLFEQALAQSACAGTVSIDREDSIVLLFPGDPHDCLDFATWLENALTHDPRFTLLPLRVGVNLGPVIVSRNELNETQVSGAGVDDALRVAHAGMLREILMSRSYYTVLSRASLNDRLLRHKAFISDERDQSFAVYQIATIEQLNVEPEIPSEVFATAPVNYMSISRTRWSAVAASVIVFAAGIVIFQNQRGPEVQQAQLPITAAKPKVAAVVAQPPAASSAAIVVTEPEPIFAIDAEPIVSNVAVVEPAPLPVQSPTPKAMIEPFRKVATNPNVTVQLAIKPWGEIYVDGKKVGITPPLRKLKLPPGKREIVVRNADFMPFQTTLDVQPETLLQISHRFDK